MIMQPLVDEFCLDAFGFGNSGCPLASGKPLKLQGSNGIGRMAYSLAPSLQQAPKATVQCSAFFLAAQYSRLTILQCTAVVS